MNNLAITYQHIADILSFETPKSQLEKTLSQASFNWETIIKEGSKHFIIPTIYCRLKTKQLLHLLPEDLIAYFEYITSENRKRNEIVLMQVHSISELFNSEHIEHVFLKGSALLALGCFNDIAERMLGDIDILVAPNQLKKAYNLLCKNGYYPSKQTLGNDFFEHKHLPRLKTELSPTRIAAVEIHRKLFVTYSTTELEHLSIFKDKKEHNNVFTPSIKHLMMHNVLNFQINDYGALYNSISFRSIYDTIILQQKYKGNKEWYKNKIFKKYFIYSSLFFNDIIIVKHGYTRVLTGFYLFKLKHIKFYKSWNKLLKLISFIPIITNRMCFFMSNSSYRKAVIKDRKRIFAHFTSILSNN